MEAALAPDRLVAIAAEWAASVTAAACPVLRPHARTYERAAHERDHDVWIIHWGPGSGLEPHDHGPSAGAFYVARGQPPGRHRVERACVLAPAHGHDVPGGGASSRSRARPVTRQRVSAATASSRASTSSPFV